jgi:GNAT superfamily N-acetyltransferase
MGQVTVRRVRSEDAARVRALRLEMLADSPLAYLETLDEAAARPHAQFQARIAGNASGTESGQFVAEADERLVGQAAAFAPPSASGVTLIYAVYVTPDWRGTGVLGQLVDAVAEWSRQAGRPWLELEVVIGNDRAVRAYQRLGFRDTGRRTPHPTIPVLTELAMSRPA